MGHPARFLLRRRRRPIRPGLCPRSVEPDSSPALIVPYMWIGDFVRCHSVVQLLRAQFPERPVDMLSTTLCAPLADYMPGLRKAIRRPGSTYRQPRQPPGAPNAA